MASKGKEVATGTSSSGDKRKRGGGADEDNPGSGRKRRNREVLQFFEDTAEVDDDESDQSDFDDDEFDIELKVKKEPVKMQNISFIPKEEAMDEEEFDKMMEERYKEGSSFVTYAEDDFETKSMERNIHFPSSRDPTIWKVKCMVGRERHSAFCLMQKFADLKSLGTKLQIISAFAVDHVKGFVYIEADKQCDITEACKGLCSIYSTRVASVPKNEVSHILSVRSKSNVVSEGMWARIKNGKYKGDLAQVVAVNDARKRATVKLIPRIDLQALAQKFGGGVSMKNAATPAPRLLSSSELEEFRPLVQYRRDRDTGRMFEVLDGLMLKDGYLYKRVSVDSLSCWGVMPSEEELLKFQPSENNESDNSEWLKQIYGTPKKKRVIGNGKGSEKGESSSGSGADSSFELYDLVCFGRKDFGLIVGMEKDDYYKILKDGPEAPVVVTVVRHELKNGPSDMKFIALDHRMKTVSINDTVRVLEGPLKDRQGIAKQIYRGIIFMYDENETENGGYFCSKAQMCEKIKLSFDASSEKGGESGPVGFEDFPSSPKSPPLSPKKPWQTKENSREFNRGDKDGMFSIGQTLRIRVGPLKGYLCRVLAIRYSDVTVKLDSQQKVLTVKCEHLSEVRGKSSAMPVSDDLGSSSLKPFDLLGTEGGSTGWTDGAGTSADGDRWNTGGATTESSWPSFSSSGLKLQSESNFANSSGSADNNTKEDASWERKASNQNSFWGAAAADDKAVANNGQVHGWGNEDSWNKASTNVGSSSGASVGWGKATLPSENPAGASRDSGDGWGQSKLYDGNSTTDAATAWDKGKTVIGNPTTSWGDIATKKNQLDSLGSSKDVVQSGSWNSKSSSAGDDHCNNATGWNQQKSQNKDNWGSTAEALNKDTVHDSWGKRSRTGTDPWNKDEKAQNKVDTWGGTACGSWAQPDLGNADEASGWMKAKVDGAGQTANWGNQKNQSEDATGWTRGGSCGQTQSDNWNKSKTFGTDGGSCNKQEGESAWGKPDGGPSWNKQDGSSWGKSEGVSSWSKQDGGSSGNQDRFQEFGGWNKTFDGGRGSGGRRGGGRGGRGQFGRGRRPFGEDQSSGWKKGGEGSNWTGDGTPSRNPSGWGNDQVGGWVTSDVSEEGREGDQKKPNSSWGDNGAGWNKSKGAGKEIGENWDKWNCAKPSFEKKSSWGDEKGECQGDDKSLDHNQSLGGQTEAPKWNASNSVGGNWTTDWNKGPAANEGPSQSWGGGSKSNTEKASTGDATGWISGTCGVGTKQTDWGAPKCSKSSWDNKAGDVDNSQPSGWGSKSSWCGSKFSGQKSDEIGKASENKDQDGWNGGRALSGGLAKGWGQSASLRSGSNDAGKNHDSDWAKNGGTSSGTGDSCGKDSSWGKRNWNSGSNDADGNQDSGWGKKNNFNSESSDVNQSSGYGKKSSWNCGSNDADGNQDSSWGKKNNFKAESSDANQISGCGKKSSWNSGSGDASWNSSGWGKKSSWNPGDSDVNRDSFVASGEDQTENSSYGSGGGNSRGGFKGRGGSFDRGGLRGRGERGGFGGRNGSDRGFGGRGRSNGGGFGCRGGSDRGGFGGRDRFDRGYGGRGGGRRDHSSWNENNDSGDDKAFDWKNRTNNAGGGWKTSGGSSWNQGGADKSQLQSWNSQNDGSSNQSGGWGKGTSAVGESNDSRGKSSASSWGNKGDGDGNDGGWKTSGDSWNQRGADKAFDWKNGTNNDGKGWKTSGGSWNQGGADNSQPRRLDSKNDESSNQAGGWGKGTNAGGESNDSWGKSSASSWGNKGDGNDLGWKTSGGSWSQRGADEGNGNQAGGWGKDTNAGGEPSDSGGKAPGSSWGNKGDGGSSKGGW
ncbi:protein RNA-directed DNA methylation 3 isoform X2 [Hevea brasiliensis]|uniref:protein RNA-directed DNA methylation 3 isoform X2 n=1 Tax=Hevea brasiliensis TaxID=3981 RepID=UPI0025DE0D05|nr:protein RNA-directed DNA methylation 3 isoform X2 [Hevea brasiliensis]